MRFFIALLLAGCTVEHDTAQPIKVTWAKDSAEVERLCGGFSPLEPLGCARQNRSEINPKGSCEIVAIKPRGFDDARALEILGHELLHCLWGPVHI